MTKLLREAWFFTRTHLKPLLAIALIYTLPSTLMELSRLGAEEPLPQNQQLVIGALFICLGVIQFGAAMIFIHRRVEGAAVSLAEAISLALKQLLPLLLVNILMALMIAGGLMLLILPGLFLAYKLLFAEFMLLFHGMGPIDALKASYRSTRGLAGEILPPLLLWAGLVIAVSVAGTLLFNPDGESGALGLLVQEGLSMLVSVYGWALLYRLYQCFITAQIAAPARPDDEF
ncbi:YciC family protein [Motiliproteus sediminis]|uniref:YciC family protein n=1 Tax=Motiliproteus sediminis TaxID=1468178 RepID=UPI001AEF4932|nr:YciC family protein [Motiliproteus sediminis]